MKYLRKIVLGCFYSIVLLLVGYISYYVYENPPGGGNHVLKKLDTPAGLFVVGGQCGGPINGWDTLLYWKRPNELWVDFRLDRESDKWSDVELSFGSNKLTISRAGRVVKNLSVDQDRLFEDMNANSPAQEYRPDCVFKSDPFGGDWGGRCLDDASPEWNKVWPKLKKNEKDIVWDYPQ